MFKENAKSVDTVSAALASALGADNAASAGGVYRIECRDKDGNLKWVDETHNLVVNVGLQDMNAKYFTGSTYTATWYIGLYGAAASNNPAASDTAALHAGWTEITPYSNATRPACTFGTATTADGIQLTSGQGITFEGNYIPTGAIAAITSTGTARLIGRQG